MENKYIITFEPENNKIQIDSFINQSYDLEIYGDNELIWRIENETPNRWHIPAKNLVYFKKVSVKLIGKKSIDNKKYIDIDPFNEEDWSEDEVIMEKSWNIESDIKVKEM